ncbi:MAG: GumC family protein [Acidobacteriaceae bacterium]
MLETSNNAAKDSREGSARPDDEVSLLDLLAAIGRKKRILGITVLAALLIGLLLAFLLPKKYTAETTLLPPHQQNSLSSMLASNLGGLGAVASLTGNDLGLKNPNDMYVAMFRSRTVEDAMIQKYGLMREYHAKLLSKARKTFESNTQVDGSSKDGLIHISVTDRNPQQAAKLANGYVTEFRDLSNHLAISDAAQRRMFFQQQMQTAKEQLTHAEEDLVSTEQTSGMIEIGGQTRALIEAGAQLKAQIAAKEVEIQGMQSFAAPDNPNLVQAKLELKAFQSQLARLAGKGGNPGNELILPKGKLPKAGLEYLRKYRQVQYDQAIFDILAKQFEIAKLDEAREGALIQVVDPATPPDHKSSPKRALILAGSLAGGLFLGIFMALAAAGLESMNENPETRLQLQQVKDAFRFGSIKH